MIVRITQIDGRLPNLALMRLSSFHKSRGDEVYFSRSVYRDLLGPQYDRVYGSAIFSTSRKLVERFASEFPGAILGGTGSGSLTQVESIIGDWDRYDYSIYPGFFASIGMTQRGCRLKCKFCVVPMKEGKNRSTNTISDIWRGSPFPKHIHLLDNDFFGQPADEWRARIKEIRDGNFRVCLNQGVNVRLIDDEAAEALASIEYRDDQFRKRRLYTAWDNLKDEGVFFRGVERLERAGIPPKHLMVYMLIGFDPSETWDRIHYRFGKMVAAGMQPYPMVYDPARRDLKDFQRWVVTGLYRAVPWHEYRPRGRRLASSEQMTLSVEARATGGVA